MALLYFDYLSPKGKIMATVRAEVRTTPKRIIVIRQVTPIQYRTQPGTKNALYFKCPKMFHRATGKPIPNPSVSRGWWLAVGEVQRLEREMTVTQPATVEPVCQPS